MQFAWRRRASRVRGTTCMPSRRGRRVPRGDWRGTRFDPACVMDALLQDLRFAIRSLVRHPGFAVTALVTLALGIGATTAIFSVVNSVLLRALPFPDPHRLVIVGNLWTKTGVLS